MSMFQRRHYEAIAKVLKERKPEAKNGHSDNNDILSVSRDGRMVYHEGFLLMRDLAVMFTDDNLHFDLARFEVACGYEEASIAVWLPDGMGAKS